MSAEVSAAELDQFRAVLARQLGLDLCESKVSYLADVLRRRLIAATTDTSVSSYLQKLSAPAGRQELRSLATELTIGETYFFRNAAQFRAFVDVVLPARMAAHSKPGTLRFLSAGCSSGEEAYSIAMICRDQTSDRGFRAQVCGLDLNPTVVERARAGRYSSWSLRETSDELQSRWFRPQGRDFVLDANIKADVTFFEGNLNDENADDNEIWRPGTYDAVFCRNVLMYFTDEAARRVVARIARALLPDGFLFVGHAETLRGLSNDFHLRHTHDTFYYSRKETLSEFLPVRSAPRRAVPVVRESDLDNGWIAAVQRSAERIKTLSEPARLLEEPALEAGPDLSATLELLRSERFAEALELLSRLPAAWADDPDVLLLRAALLTHSGSKDAETACHALLACDELSAGAYYLLALCRESAGDTAGSLENDQMAVYLDPSFAMPRMHMGLLARRSGDAAGAKRDLRQAAALLEREDASRLLLFGGGFGREALLALCRSGGGKGAR